jgi:hypothetical protein
MHTYMAILVLYIVKEEMVEHIDKGYRHSTVRVRLMVVSIGLFSL